tara:strand:+ start:456 stop:1559 length:1104 start_codon:yes stop_codon:yes gene_type:complete
MTSEKEHMMHALKLAEKGVYTASPNPMVGCVIVKNGSILGEGWHIKPGDKHAETMAINNVKERYGTSAKEKLNGSTAFINLEPCSKKGRTPPCTKAIIESGIKKIFIANEDPTQNGVEELLNSGIEIKSGILKKVSENLNKGFFSRINKKRPHITCKLACSLDGGIALSNGESKWISSKESRVDVQRMRAKSDVILTGIGTVLNDNPRLNVRIQNENENQTNTYFQPIRCILDSKLSLKGTENVLQDRLPTLVFHKDTKKIDYSSPSVELIKIKGKNGQISLKEVMKCLVKKEINYILVESGPKLVSSLVKEKLIDELVIYFSPKLLGKEKLNFIKLKNSIGTIDLNILDIKEIGKDLKLKAEISYR